MCFKDTGEICNKQTPPEMERKMLFWVCVSQLSRTRDPTVICQIACGKLLTAYLSGFYRNPSMQMFTITHTQKELLKMTYALLYANHSTPGTSLQMWEHLNVRPWHFITVL